MVVTNILFLWFCIPTAQLEDLFLQSQTGWPYNKSILWKYVLFCMHGLIIDASLWDWYILSFADKVISVQIILFFSIVVLFKCVQPNLQWKVVPLALCHEIEPFLHLAYQQWVYPCYPSCFEDLPALSSYILGAIKSLRYKSRTETAPQSIVRLVPS